MEFKGTDIPKSPYFELVEEICDKGEDDGGGDDGGDDDVNDGNDDLKDKSDSSSEEGDNRSNCFDSDDGDENGLPTSFERLWYIEILTLG